MPEPTSQELLEAAVAAQSAWLVAEAAAQTARNEYATALAALEPLTGESPVSGAVGEEEYIAHQLNGVVIVEPASRTGD